MKTGIVCVCTCAIVLAMVSGGVSWAVASCSWMELGATFATAVDKDGGGDFYINTITIDKDGTGNVLFSSEEDLSENITDCWVSDDGGENWLDIWPSDNYMSLADGSNELTFLTGTNDTETTGVITVGMRAFGTSPPQYFSWRTCAE